MQLTKHTDFALRCLLYIGSLPTNQLATITEISERLHIPRNHLMKIVNKLGQLGYIHTTRGPKGGVKLAIVATEINLARLIKQLEVQLELVNCAEPLCPIKGHCALKRALNEAQAAFFQVLEQHTLADLITNSKVINFPETLAVARLHTP
jgi:Rrf2 family nitric oxide-sensitive transcriptional repressor